MIEDINDVSRAQEDRIDLASAEQPLGELIHTTVTAAQETFATKGVRLQVVPVTSPVSVLVDRQRFDQVMSNLLTNALRHTPAGGQVTISARQQGSGTVLIDIADAGEGLTRDQMGHTFERFYRGDAAHNRDSGGSGISLTVLLQSGAESGEDSVSHSLMAAACGRCQAVSKTRLTITASGFGCP